MICGPFLQQVELQPVVPQVSSMGSEPDSGTASLPAIRMVLSVFLVTGLSLEREDLSMVHLPHLIIIDQRPAGLPLPYHEDGARHEDRREGSNEQAA